jgi:membrane protein required for colicin V production
MELSLTWFDYGFITVILISTIYGFFRGFTREVFSLATWFLAFWISKIFVGPVSEFLTS